MSHIEDLKTELDAWRESIKSERQEARTKNPYGQQINDLNVEWGEKKKAHKERLAKEEGEYRARISRLQAMSDTFIKEQPPAGPSGRKPNPDFSDEIKILAFHAEKDFGRTVVRGLLGLTDTKKLDRILAEGKGLAEQVDTTEEEEW